MRIILGNNGKKITAVTKKIESKKWYDRIQNKRTYSRTCLFSPRNQKINQKQKVKYKIRKFENIEKERQDWNNRKFYKSALNVKKSFRPNFISR